MKELLIRNRVFLTLYILFLLIGGILILTHEKGSEILYINGLHNQAGDVTFKWITQLSEAPLFLFILVVAIRFSYGMGLVLLVNSSVVFLIVQFFKKIVFESQVRPAIFFQGKAELNFVQGVEVATRHSFPSGHTAAAFALFTMLALMIDNKKWSLLFFALAVMVGISRVYLLQHFFRDVYAGSLIGVGTSIVFYLLVVQSRFYQNLHWKDKSLMKK